MGNTTIETLQDSKKEPSLRDKIGDRFSVMKSKAPEVTEVAVNLPVIGQVKVQLSNEAMQKIWEVYSMLQNGPFLKPLSLNNIKGTENCLFDFKQALKEIDSKYGFKNEKLSKLITNILNESGLEEIIQKWYSIIENKNGQYLAKYGEFKDLTHTPQWNEFMYDMITVVQPILIPATFAIMELCGRSSKFVADKKHQTALGFIRFNLKYFTEYADSFTFDGKGAGRRKPKMPEFWYEEERLANAALASGDESYFCTGILIENGVPEWYDAEKQTSMPITK